MLTPSGRRVPLQDEEAEVLELSEQGFYEVRGATGSEPTVIASNVDPMESDLTPIEPSDISVAAVGDPGASDPSSGRSEPLTPEAQEKQPTALAVPAFCGGSAARGGYGAVESPGSQRIIAGPRPESPESGAGSPEPKSI
jgi:hypothetical protein